jgi:hypothetical protein
VEENKMATNLSYQQARKIRKTKFTDLFVDQLAQKDTGVFRAIGKSISLKSKARVEGIKEKFDPLNIAKFLTFGSKVGPALLGKMLGRNQKDIDYFTNRTRSIKGGSNTADKIKKVPGGDTEGINEQLSKIYSFLKTSREEDVKLRESAKNYEEEFEMEKKNRHKELLATLNKLVNSGGGKLVTATKEEGPSIFDILMEKIKALGDLVGEMTKTLVEMAKKLGMPIARALGSAASQVGRLLGGALASPIGMASGVAAAFLTPFAMAAIEKEKIDKDPYAKEYDNNAYALSVRNKKEGGNLTEGAAAEQLRQKSLKQVPRNQIVEIVKSDLPDNILQEEFGNTREGLKKWLVDNPKTPMYQVPMAGLQKSTAAPVPTTPAPVEKTGNVTNQRPTMENDPRRTDQSPPTASPAAATPTSSSVAPLTNTNTDLNLTQHFSSDKPGVSKTVVNNSTKQPTGPGLKPSQVSVRNDEPTFMRLIEESTRLV